MFLLLTMESFRCLSRLPRGCFRFTKLLFWVVLRSFLERSPECILGLCCKEPRLFVRSFPDPVIPTWPRLVDERPSEIQCAHLLSTRYLSEIHESSLAFACSPCRLPSVNPCGMRRPKGVICSQMRCQSLSLSGQISIVSALFVLAMYLPVMISRLWCLACFALSSNLLCLTCFVQSSSLLRLTCFSQSSSLLCLTCFSQSSSLLCLTCFSQSSSLLCLTCFSHSSSLLRLTCFEQSSVLLCLACFSQSPKEVGTLGSDAVLRLLLATACVYSSLLIVIVRSEQQRLLALT